LDIPRWAQVKFSEYSDEDLEAAVLAEEISGAGRNPTAGYALAVLQERQCRNPTHARRKILARINKQKKRPSRWARRE
jgi:hypothetical protein